MNACLPILLCLLFASPVIAGEPGSSSSASASENTDSPRDLTNTQAELLRITATVDGSGKLVFTRQSVHYEHKHWEPPTNVVFAGVHWTDLSSTPAGWLETVARLDLTKAWIVKRKGRDVIALEQTPDGFDLFLCDSPNGADEYDVTIAIPRQP